MCCGEIWFDLLVEEFSYPSLVIVMDVETRIAKATSVFNCLQKSTFTNQLIFKKNIVVLATLLIRVLGSQDIYTHQFEVFYYWHTRCMLGVTYHQQWIEHIASKTILISWGLEWHMKWLEHLCRMEVNQQPKILFEKLHLFVGQGSEWMSNTSHPKWSHLDCSFSV